MNETLGIDPPGFCNIATANDHAEPMRMKIPSGQRQCCQKDTTGVATMAIASAHGL